MAPSNNKKSSRRARMSRQFNSVAEARVTPRDRPPRVEHDVIEGVDIFSFNDELELDYFTNLEEPLLPKIHPFRGFDEEEVSANLVKNCFDKFFKNYESSGNIFGADYDLPVPPKAVLQGDPGVIVLGNDEIPLKTTDDHAVMTDENHLKTTDEHSLNVADSHTESQNVVTEVEVDNGAAPEVITIDESDDDDVVIIGDPSAPVPKPVRDCVCPNCGKVKRKDPPPKAGTSDHGKANGSTEKDEVMIIADEDLPDKPEQGHNVAAQQHNVSAHPGGAPARRTDSRHDGISGSNGMSIMADEVLVIDDDSPDVSPKNVLVFTETKRKAPVAQPDELAVPKIRKSSPSETYRCPTSQRVPDQPGSLASQVWTTSSIAESPTKSQPKVSSWSPRLIVDSVFNSCASAPGSGCRYRVSNEPGVLSAHQKRNTVAAPPAVGSRHVYAKHVERSIDSYSKPHTEYSSSLFPFGGPLGLGAARPEPVSPCKLLKSPSKPSSIQSESAASRSVEVVPAVSRYPDPTKAPRVRNYSNQVRPLPRPLVNLPAKPALKNQSALPGTVRLVLPDSGKTVILRLDGSKSKMLPPSAKTSLMCSYPVVSPKNRVAVPDKNKPVEPRVASEPVVAKPLVASHSHTHVSQSTTSGVAVVQTPAAGIMTITQGPVVEPATKSVVREMVDFVCRNEQFPMSYKYDEERLESPCSVVPCRQERCRFGCICISLAKKTVRRVRCKNASCIFGCTCLSRGKYLILKNKKKAVEIRPKQVVAVLPNGAERVMTLCPGAGTQMALKTFLPIQKVIGVPSGHLERPPATFAVPNPKPAQAVLGLASSPKTDGQPSCPNPPNGPSIQPRRFFGREKVPIPERALACLTPGVGYVPLLETTPRVILSSPFAPGTTQSFLHVRQATEWLNSELRPILLTGSELRWVVVDKSTIEKKALHRLCIDSLKLLPALSCDTKNGSKIVS